jgi:Tol biopolymer transport system component
MFGEDPDWSPDGSRFVFSCEYYDICVANIDGSGKKKVYDANQDGLGASCYGTVGGLSFQAADPTWSPDGDHIGFVLLVERGDGKCGTNFESSSIMRMKADGSGLGDLVTEGSNTSPDWSPDGSKIAFCSERNGISRVYVVNANGGAASPITPSSQDSCDPVWSPDGTKIAYDEKAGIAIINATGGAKSVVPGTSFADAPSWQPIAAAGPCAESSGRRTVRRSLASSPVADTAPSPDTLISVQIFGLVSTVLAPTQPAQPMIDDVYYANSSALNPVTTTITREIC